MTTLPLLPIWILGAALTIGLFQLARVLRHEYPVARRSLTERHA